MTGDSRPHGGPDADEAGADEIALAERATVDDPANAGAWAELGSAYGRAGRWADALGANDRALELAPGSATIWRRRSVALRGLGRRSDAVSAAERARELGPDDATEYWALAWVLNTLDRHDRALDLADEGITAFPDSAILHRERGSALDALGRSAEAVEAIDRGLALDPTEPRLHSGRAAVLRKLERSDEATLSAFRAAELDPVNWRLRCELASDLRRAGRAEEAVVEARRATELGPGEPLAWTVLSYALTTARQPRRNLAAADRAVELAPDTVGPWHARAGALQALGRSGQELKSRERAAELDPGHAGLAFLVAVRLEQAHRFREAALQCDVALEIDPEHLDTLKCKARCLIGLRRYEDALSVADSGLAISSSDPVLSHIRTAALRRLGRSDAMEGTDGVSSEPPALSSSPRTAQFHLGGLGPVRFTPVVVVIIAVNVIAFALSREGFDWAVTHCALNPQSVRNGEYYRLFSALFLHVDARHLVINLGALAIFGSVLEEMIGRLRFAATYLLSGLAGSAASYFLLPPSSYALGASGAIFGVMAACAVVALRRRLRILPLVVLIAANLIASIALHEGWQAHLGGLAAGTILGWAYSAADVPTPARARKVARGITLAVLLATVGIVGLRTIGAGASDLLSPGTRPSVNYTPGAPWTFASFPPPANSDDGAEWSAITCMGATDCIAGGYDDNSTDGVVFVTTVDHGHSWRWRIHALLASLDDQLDALACGPDRKCLAMADGSAGPGRLVGSTDAGRTWHPIADPPGWQSAGTVPDQVACSADMCIVSGTGPAGPGGVRPGATSLAVTSDGGRTWRPAILPEGTSGLWSLTCSPGDYCSAETSDSSTHLVSTDGGASWSSVRESRPPGTQTDFRNIACTTTSHCLWVEDHALWQSNDGGSTWIPVSMPSATMTGGDGSAYHLVDFYAAGTQGPDSVVIIGDVDGVDGVWSTRLPIT